MFKRGRYLIAGFALVLLSAMLSPASAGAQLVEVTPAVFGKVRQIAEAARAQHPTSPTSAVNAFVIAFNVSLAM